MKNFHPISFYLNQKFVFDILAILEDGFSEMQTLRKVDNTENATDKQIKGDIGISNAFGFLGVSLGGHRNKNEKAGSQEEAEFKKVHTPNSLFAKMREILFKKNLVRTRDLMKVKPGEFIEFKAVLRKNPIIDNLESYFSVFKLAMNFQDQPNNKQQKSEQQTNKKLIEQFENLVQQLKAGGNIDLIGEHTGEEKFNSVLTIDGNYLNDPSLSDLADGEFSVFGKVIRVLEEDSKEKINLLRKTSLSKINDALLNQMFSGFQNLEEGGLENADFDKEVNPPVIQVIPISIFT
jgi:hypothetical protein